VNVSDRQKRVKKGRREKEEIKKEMGRQRERETDRQMYRYTKLCSSYKK
jgi:hypothetical protein